MRTYRISIAWIVFGFLLVICFAVISFLVRDLRGLWFVTLLCLGVFSELTSRVKIDTEGLSTSIGVFPLFPYWHKTVHWVDVIEVRAAQNLFSVEADTLHIVVRSLSGKQQHIYIPFVLYARRNELLRQILSLLPSHVAVSPALVKWAETVGLTPKWQLGVALALLLLLAGILWWSSIPH